LRLCNRGTDVAGDNVPIPDPTKLTTDAVAAAKAEIEKLFDVKLLGFRQLVLEMFAGRDTALKAALDTAKELVKQQNDSNTVASDKMSQSFTKQIENLDDKIDTIKERMSDLDRKNYAVVGAYIVGAVGIAGMIAAAVMLRH
jgi:hypothetical protein